MLENFFPRLKYEAGFSLIEVMLSVGLLGAVASAYLANSNTSIRVERRQLHRQDLSMMRYYIKEHFSCDASLLDLGNGKWDCPPSGSFQARAFGSVKSFADETSTKELGEYRVTSRCKMLSADGPAEISFRASRLDTNPITGKKYLLPGYVPEDPLDGNPILCANQPSVNETPKNQELCTSAFIRESSPAKIIGQMFGPAFRDISKAGDLTFRIRVKRDVDIPGENKPAKWQLQFINKDPSTVNGKKNTKTPSTAIPGPIISLAANPGKVDNLCNVPSLPGISSALNEASLCDVDSYWQEDISLKKARPPATNNPESTWFGVPLELKIAALNAANDSIAVCSSNFSLMSPLAFFLGQPADQPAQLFSTITNFDINADGKKDRIFWPGTSAGLLTLDLNGDGIVNSGEELFGDASPVPSQPSQRSANGFAALAQYDADHSGRIDAKDLVFAKLKLWFDRNNDGFSDPWELIPVASVGITSIALDYKEVKEAPAGEHGFLQARYEGSFSGSPGCVDKPCKVYDLYFGMLSSPATIAHLERK